MKPFLTGTFNSNVDAAVRRMMVITDTSKAAWSENTCSSELLVLNPQASVHMCSWNNRHSSSIKVVLIKMCFFIGLLSAFGLFPVDLCAHSVGSFGCFVFLVVIVNLFIVNLCVFILV